MVFVEEIKIFHQDELPYLVLVVRGGLVKIGLLYVSGLQVVLHSKLSCRFQTVEKVPFGSMEPLNVGRKEEGSLASMPKVKLNGVALMERW